MIKHTYYDHGWVLLPVTAPTYRIPKEEPPGNWNRFPTYFTATRIYT